MTYTEVVNAAALLHGSRPTFHLLEVSAVESPVVAHLYGFDPGVMAEAAAMVESLRRFDAIDGAHA
jgi:tRNA-dihydrouridine synthase